MRRKETSILLSLFSLASSLSLSRSGLSYLFVRVTVGLFNRSAQQRILSSG
jgi:hypothetical protein